MSTNYLGGIWKHGPADRRRGNPPSPDTVQEDWGWVGDNAELFVRGAPACGRLFTWDALALFIRGYARPRGSTGPLDLERLAEELRCHYLEHGTLAVDDLEGCFTLALLDSQASRVILYRNLVGSGFTYYHPAPGGFLFGGNLSELVDASGVSPRANRDVLPSFFLYRCVPGAETLFSDFYRLLPGEQVTWDTHGLTRVQRHHFGHLTGSVAQDSLVLTPEEAVDRLEQTMAAVMADCAAIRPGASNLLSGGVDSTYLQAIWNKGLSGRLGKGHAARSFSVSVNHPHTLLDTNYALTAGEALGCNHSLVPADGPYATYLIDVIGSTGEPPNHVQSAYFGHLARNMVAQGVTAGICGEGADSLFGLGLANHVHNAETLRRLLPLQPLRQLAGLVSGLVGWDRLAYTCRLAGHLDDHSHLEHPINRVASFTDWAAVEACFGRTGLDSGTTARRALLDRFALPQNPMDRLHAMGFLGEAMDSAGLWTTLFNRAGADMLCPFLDSRMVGFGLSLPGELRYPFRRPKEMLKSALSRHVPETIARRSKLGFGQPIFEWLSPGGQLHRLVDRLQAREFIEPAVLEQAKSRPGWFLYSLLCYDLWHRMFIERSLARPTAPTPSYREGSAGLAVAG